MKLQEWKKSGQKLLILISYIFWAVILLNPYVFMEFIRHLLSEVLSFLHCNSLSCRFQLRISIIIKPENFHILVECNAILAFKILEGKRILRARTVFLLVIGVFFILIEGHLINNFKLCFASLCVQTNTVKLDIRSFAIYGSLPKLLRLQVVELGIPNEYQNELRVVFKELFQLIKQWLTTGLTLKFDKLLVWYLWEPPEIRGQIYEIMTLLLKVDISLFRFFIHIIYNF